MITEWLPLFFAIDWDRSITIRSNWEMRNERFDLSVPMPRSMALPKTTWGYGDFLPEVIWRRVRGRSSMRVIPARRMLFSRRAAGRIF